LDATGTFPRKYPATKKIIKPNPTITPSVIHNFFIQQYPFTIYHSPNFSRLTPTLILNNPVAVITRLLTGLVRPNLRIEREFLYMASENANNLVQHTELDSITTNACNAMTISRRLGTFFLSKPKEIRSDHLKVVDGMKL
jgi:hypothetical protein